MNEIETLEQKIATQENHIDKLNMIFAIESRFKVRFKKIARDSLLSAPSISNLLTRGRMLIANSDAVIS